MNKQGKNHFSCKYKTLILTVAMMSLTACGGSGGNNQGPSTTGTVVIKINNNQTANQ